MLFFKKFMFVASFFLGICLFPSCTWATTQEEEKDCQVYQKVFQTISKEDKLKALNKGYLTNYFLPILAKTAYSDNPDELTDQKNVYGKEGDQIISAVIRNCRTTVSEATKNYKGTVESFPDENLQECFADYIKYANDRFKPDVPIQNAMEALVASWSFWKPKTFNKSVFPLEQYLQDVNTITQGVDIKSGFSPAKKKKKSRSPTIKINNLQVLSVPLLDKKITLEQATQTEERPKNKCCSRCLIF